MNLQKISNKELRHLNSSEMSQLASILDNNNNWIKLLEAIPKDLNNISKNQLDSKYERKYNSEYADILRTAAQRQQRSPSFMLLFEEWGTSGRQRPTIQYLYDLLISLPLYRAADYIADQILHIQRPNRPNTGPGKQIDITLPEPRTDSNLIRGFLEAYRYPNTTTTEHSEFDTNHENQDKNYYENNISYTESIGLPRNEFTESSQVLCSSSTEVTETEQETSEYNDRNSTYASDMEPCLPIFEQIGFDDGQVNNSMPDVSIFKLVNC